MNGRDAVRVGGSALLAGWGVLLVARPAEVARRLSPGSPPPETVLRVLGARRVAQHLAVAVVGSRALALTGAATDGLHAVSMLAAARVWPQYRRAALTSAAVATAAAVLTAGSAPRRLEVLP